MPVIVVGKSSLTAGLGLRLVVDHAYSLYNGGLHRAAVLTLTMVLAAVALVVMSNSGSNSEPVSNAHPPTLTAPQVAHRCFSSTDCAPSRMHSFVPHVQCCAFVQLLCMPISNGNLRAVMKQRHSKNAQAGVVDVPARD